MLIFVLGKMVVTGTKSEEDSRLASRKYPRIIQKLGFGAKFSEFKIFAYLIRSGDNPTLAAHPPLALSPRFSASPEPPIQASTKRQSWDQECTGGVLSRLLRLPAPYLPYYHTLHRF